MLQHGYVLLKCVFNHFENSCIWVAEPVQDRFPCFKKPKCCVQPPIVTCDCALLCSSMHQCYCKHKYCVQDKKIEHFEFGICPYTLFGIDMAWAQAPVCKSPTSAGFVEIVPGHPAMEVVVHTISFIR